VIDGIKYKRKKKEMATTGEGVVYPLGEDGKVLGSVLAGKQMIAASYEGMSTELASAALGGSLFSPFLSQLPLLDGTASR
jgi:hypothetical protein